MKCFAAAILMSISIAAAAPKDVLILHSYRVGYDWTDELSRGFRTKFASAGEYNLWFEFLDARRQGYPRNAAAFREELARKHAGRRFDLIIASDDEALDFVAHRSEGIFGTPPVVFCGVSDAPDSAKFRPDRFTGLIEVFYPEKILALAVNLRPHPRHFYFVSDNTAFGTALNAVFQKAAARFFPQMAYHVIDGHTASLEEIKAAVAAIPSDSILLISQFRQDHQSRYIDAATGEQAIAAASQVPVFGVAVSQVGQGILMGTPNRGFEHAALATDVAVRILKGAAPSSIPVATDGGVNFLFDHGELTRWNIAENRLPSGSQIVNREPGVWREYWRWIVAGAMLAAFQLFAIAFLIVNILRRRRIQAELRHALDAAREAGALKSRFIANMSHELRTPMNGVLGLLQALEATELDENQRESATLAADSARSLLTVLNDILDISQIDAGRLKIRSGPFSLRHELAGSCRLLLPRAQAAGIGLRWTMDPAIPGRLTGDADRLRQVLINLASNALKFTQEGEIHVDAREIFRIEQESTIRIEVRDTGIGIPPEQMSRIFEPFTQVDDSSSRKFGGAGLGLAISRELVELMGGRIGGESTPGQGSLFWLEIPFPIAAEADPPEDPPPTSFDGRVVLLVEDNAVNRLVVRKLLERTGCQTLLAEDGGQCLQLLHDTRVDLILMDVQMPGMSGLEVTRHIRALDEPVRRVPIIALTASSMVGDREECLAAGMDDYLSKPIDAPSLLRVLDRWIPTAPARRRAAAVE